MIRAFIILLALNLAASQAWSETVYVSDVFFVPVRSGAGTQFRIVHSGIRTGTQMTRLEQSTDGEWSLVRTEGGLEGWIPNQYVSTTPTARLQLTDAQNRLTQANQRAQNLDAELKKLRDEYRTTSRTADDYSKERDRLDEELRQLRALSADAINLNQRYQSLLAKHELMQTEYDAVRAENDRLKSDQTINQWLFGAGLMIFGMILMWILPAFARRKRHTDWAN